MGRRAGRRRSSLSSPATMRSGRAHAVRSLPGGRSRAAWGAATATRRSCDGGVVLDTTRLDAVRARSRARGRHAPQAGVTLGDAAAASSSPRGGSCPVVPGTQHVTVGGAIASDIHGKNHAAAGTFGAHVEAIGLLTAERRARRAHAGSTDLFGRPSAAWADRRDRLGLGSGCSRCPAPLLSVDTDRVTSLDEALAVLDGPGGAYRVAWLDLLGSSPGPGDRHPGRHTRRGAATPAPAGPPPSQRALDVSRPLAATALLRPGCVRALQRAAVPPRAARARGRSIESFGAHMFPLDGLDAWPRLYGPAGLVQYQLVVPRGPERRRSSCVIDAARLRASRATSRCSRTSALPTARRCRSRSPGWTLALDMPRAARRGSGRCCDTFDECVVDGRRARLPGQGRRGCDREVLGRDVPAAGRVARDPRPHRSRAACGARTSACGPGSWTPTMSALLVGGSSEIGLAIVRRLGRRRPVAPSSSAAIATGCESAADGARAGRGADTAVAVVVDADDVDAHERAVADGLRQARAVDVVVLAVGVLGRPGRARRRPATRPRRSCASTSSAPARCCCTAAQGCAPGPRNADRAVERRGRAARAPSNPIYGAAKAGLDALAQGIGDAARRRRRARARRAAGFVQDADDLRVEAGAVRDHRRSSCRGDRRGAARTGPHGLGTFALALDLCFAEAYAP